jgi:hypothetical protein
MDTFSAQVQEWQLFYATLAGASATLTGLLFVSLSLNIDLLNQPQNVELMRRARQAFAGFLYILTIALTFLVPHQTPDGLGTVLLILGGFGFYRLGRRILEMFRESRGQVFTTQFYHEYWLLLVAYLGLVVIAVGLLWADADVLYWLISVWMVLLVSASRDSWSLLVQVRGGGKAAD